MARTINAAVRNLVYGHEVRLVVHECPVTGCGIVYAIPQEYRDALCASGGRYHCPNGHSLGWSEDDADRQRKRANRAEREATRLQARLDQETAERKAAQRTAAAIKGHLTRARRRAAAGICPCCKRSFKQVRDHMQGQHPADYARIFGEGD